MRYDVLKFFDRELILKFISHLVRPKAKDTAIFKSNNGVDDNKSFHNLSTNHRLLHYPDQLALLGFCISASCGHLEGKALPLTLVRFCTRALSRNPSSIVATSGRTSTPTRRSANPSNGRYFMAQCMERHRITRWSSSSKDSNTSHKWRWRCCGLFS